MPPKRKNPSQVKRNETAERTLNSSSEEKGATFDTYVQIISDTIDELRDIYIPKLLTMKVFSSNEEAEAHFLKLKNIWDDLSR